MNIHDVVRATQLANDAMKEAQIPPETRLLVCASFQSRLIEMEIIKAVAPINALLAPKARS